MRKTLSLLAATILLAACAAPSGDDQGSGAKESVKGKAAQSRPSFAVTTERLEAPLAACVSFLETGSFDAEKLIAAGFKRNDYTFGSGTFYNLPTSEKYDLEIAMVEPKSGSQDRKCSLTGSPYDTPLIPAFENMGFDVARADRGFLASRDDTELSLTGVRYLRGYDRRPNSPIYFTIKSAKKSN